MYRVFFMHLSIDGHLGCFHVLTIANNAAVNIGVICLFELVFLFSLTMYPELGSVYHVVVLLLKKIILFYLFIWLHQVLVVAHGIFYLHCGLQDLHLWHADY